MKVYPKDRLNLVLIHVIVHISIAMRSYNTILVYQRKRVLIVDEVDDTRATLLTCIALVKKTTHVAAIGSFVLYNKVNKEKAGSMPDDVRSFVGVQIGNVWVNFPWETMP